MKNLTSDQLRSLYLKFFEERGHKVSILVLPKVL